MYIITGKRIFLRDSECLGAGCAAIQAGRERIIVMHQGRVEFDPGAAGRRNPAPADPVERFDALEGEACLRERAPAGPART